MLSKHIIIFFHAVKVYKDNPNKTISSAFFFRKILIKTNIKQFGYLIIMGFP